MENIQNAKPNQQSENAVVLNKLKNAKKEGAVRGALISGISGIIILIVAGIIGNSILKKERTTQLALIEHQQNSYNGQLASRDSLLNVWLLTFDQIEKDLNTIKEKENIMTVNSSDSEFTKDQRQQILNDISYINTLLENNRKKIASLTSQLNASGTKIKGMETMIATLETTLKQYESDIAMLKETLVQKDFEISKLNDNLTDLEITVSERDEKITDQTNIMNQAFIASGTYKELKEKGIVTKVGGFLGLGRKESLVKDQNDKYFEQVDLRETTQIPVNSASAKLISRHPSASYEMVTESDKMISYIAIKDPEQFWKYSKYAVVEIVE